MKKIVLMTMMVLLFAFLGCKGIDKEIIISKSTIQKMAEKKFPIEKESPLVQIKLFSPQIFFQDDSIGINIQYSTVLLIKKLDGTVSFKCRPVYKPETTSFYISNFELTDITVNNAGSFTGKDKLMTFISAVVNGLFSDTPVYQLNPRDYKQNMAKMLLKNVSVKGDNLVLLMSP
jgi:hypothetical protein